MDERSSELCLPVESVGDLGRGWFRRNLFSLSSTYLNDILPLLSGLWLFPYPPVLRFITSWFSFCSLSHFPWRLGIIFSKGDIKRVQNINTLKREHTEKSQWTGTRRWASCVLNILLYQSMNTRVHYLITICYFQPTLSLWRHSLLLESLKLWPVIQFMSTVIIKSYSRISLPMSCPNFPETSTVSDLPALALGSHISITSRASWDYHDRGTQLFPMTFRFTLHVSPWVMTLWLCIPFMWCKGVWRHNYNFE